MKGLSFGQLQLLKAAGTLLSPGGPLGSLLVLTYHRVLERHDPLLPFEPDRFLFAEQLDLLRKLFNVVDLADAVARLHTRTLPPRALAITFDDGYANNVDIAAPLLAERGLTATFFIATGFLDGGRMFNDTVIEAVRRAKDSLDLADLGLGTHALPNDDARRAAIDALLNKVKYLEPARRVEVCEAIAARVGEPLPNDLMMSTEQVRRLSQLGMTIGGHTITHPILTSVSDDTAKAEIYGCKERLEAIIGREVDVFAYPNGRPGGDYDERHVEIVKAAGFRVAVSTHFACARRSTDPLQVPRVGAWSPSGFKYSAKLLATLIPTFGKSEAGAARASGSRSARPRRPEGAADSSAALGAGKLPD